MEDRLATNSSSAVSSTSPIDWRIHGYRKRADDSPTGGVNSNEPRRRRVVYKVEGDREGKKYLSAIDLLIRDRRQVVRDLRYMGITAGSLFPGLDGACEELADRNFEI
jgi:hypothetical protein